MLVACLCMTISSCKKKNPSPAGKGELTNLVALLNESLTASKSNATGIISATYSKTTKILIYTVRWNIIDPENITMGSAAELDDIVSTFDKSGEKYVSPMSGSLILDEEAETALLNNQLYLNMTSEKFPLGEIRGQLLLSK